jgi:hypothetical protein
MLGRAHERSIGVDRSVQITKSKNVWRPNPAQPQVRAASQ